MSLSNCSLLVHTFNRYEKYWDGYLKGFHENFNYEGDCYFGTDVLGHGVHDFRRFKVLYSGDAEWSDRLRKLIEQIPSEWIIYFQEDMWPCRNAPNLKLMMLYIQKHKLLRLQISPVVQFYSLYGGEIPLFFHYKSKYLVSHQPSIWKRDFLLSCLKPNEDPWKNEYEGTKRLNVPEIQGKIAIYPYDWFTHESISGRKIV